MSDVVFVLGNQKLFGHKVLLSVRCPYFKTMFDSSFKERSDKDIVIEGIHPQVFLQLLTYLYSDELVIDPHQSGISLAVGLILLSDLYFLPSLLQHCLLFLWNSMSVENVTEIYSVATCEPYDKQLTSLKEKAEYIIKYNYKAVSNTKGFKALTKQQRVYLQSIHLPGKWKSP